MQPRSGRGIATLHVSRAEASRATRRVRAIAWCGEADEKVWSIGEGEIPPRQPAAKIKRGDESNKRGDKATQLDSREIGEGREGESKQEGKVGCRVQRGGSSGEPREAIAALPSSSAAEPIDRGREEGG